LAQDADHQEDELELHEDDDDRRRQEPRKKTKAIFSKKLYEDSSRAVYLQPRDYEKVVLIERQ
jgi:hypothetical protein